MAKGRLKQPDKIQQAIGRRLKRSPRGAVLRDHVRPRAPHYRLVWHANVAEKASAAKLDGNASRTVYTLRFAEAVYVLHAFQKKSRRGMATPKAELDLIAARLARAKEDYARWLRSRSSQ